MSPLISVIVPIYNVEQYLKECCDSILSQTYTNLELILVNDGSTDNSYAIAAQYEKMDERVVLLDKPNGGQSAARNMGLEYVNGDYVLFVDSDDWIEPNCIQVLFDNMRETSSDIACCRSQFINTTLNKISFKPNFRLSQIESPDILEDALCVRNFRTSPSARLYNRNFLEKYHLRFKEGIVNEDTLFSLQVASVAHKISFVNDILFNIREREGSTSRSSYKRLFQDMDTALNLAQQFIKQRGQYDDRIDKLYKARYLRSTLYNLLQIAQRLRYAGYMSDYVTCMKETQYKEYAAYSSFLPTKHRIMCALSFHPFIFYRTVRFLNAFGFRMH